MTLNSCEDSIEKELQPTYESFNLKNEVFTTTTLFDIPQDSRLIKSLKDINLKGSNRIIEYEFKIDSSVVNIQNGNGFKAYTMFMQTEKPTNDFKNLVIKIYNDSDEYEAFVFTYKRNKFKKYFDEHNAFIFEGGVSLSTVDTGQTNKTSEQACITQSITVCTQPWSGSEPTLHIATAQCKNKNHLFTMTWENCFGIPTYGGIGTPVSGFIDLCLREDCLGAGGNSHTVDISTVPIDNTVNYYFINPNIIFKLWWQQAPNLEEPLKSEIVKFLNTRKDDAMLMPSQEASVFIENLMSVFLSPNVSPTTKAAIGLLFTQINSLNINVQNDIINFLAQNNYSDEAFAFLREAMPALQDNDGDGQPDAEVDWEEVFDAYSNNSLLTVFPFVKYPDGSNYESTYPKLTEYLKNKLPTLKNNSFILNKIEEITDAPLADIKYHLEWGNGPEINIQQLDDYNDDTDWRTTALYDRVNHPDKIILDSDFINNIENSDDEQYVEDGLIFYLGAVILHEYVHFLDNLDGIDYPGEEGTIFEINTYGQDLNAGSAQWLILNKYY